MKEYNAGHDEYAFSGATVAISLVDLSSGLLTTGNLGDSHVVLGEAGESPDFEKMQMTRLSKEHSPADPREENRIAQAGGVVNWESGCARVGSLNVSRALGDLRYKAPLNNVGLRHLSRSQERAADVKDKRNGDFLSREPAISQVCLNTRRRYALLLVTDGVTDVLDDNDIVGRAATLFWGASREAKDVSEEITRESTIQPQCDNATCVTAFFKACKI